MAFYAVRRALAGIPTLLLVFTLVFLIAHATPGSPWDIGSNRPIEPSIKAALDAKFHLDEPLPVQYVQYLLGALQGLRRRRVALLAERLRETDQRQRTPAVPGGGQCRSGLPQEGDRSVEDVGAHHPGTLPHQDFRFRGALAARGPGDDDRPPLGGPLDGGAPGHLGDGNR